MKLFGPTDAATKGYLVRFVADGIADFLDPAGRRLSAVWGHSADDGAEVRITKAYPAGMGDFNTDGTGVAAAGRTFYCALATKTAQRWLSSDNTSSAKSCLEVR
jgi:hypothetical protein